MAAYCADTDIRSVAQVFSSTTEFLEATIEAWAEDYGDKIIDARMKSAGFTTPFASPDEVIIYCSALLAAAHGLRGYIGQFTGREPEMARSLEERAMGLLDDIASGKLDIGETRDDSGAPVVMDSDPETFPDTAAVVGDEESWAWPAEDRED